ncbi:MAG: HD domain-containing protein [Methylotenera sp.]|nr:HD domain-containing protein [Oligoflexia bacterium]
MADKNFLSILLNQVVVGDPLPTSVYVFINFRFITFRTEGDTIDRMTYDRLEFRKVKTLFIAEEDKGKFAQWSAQRAAEEVPLKLSAKDEKFRAVRDDVHRKTMDIFLSSHPDKIVAQTLESSKRLVDEVMKYPFAVKPLSLLQGYSKGTVDHSVNVSILSVYLAQQMGYTHQLILQHIGSGALLHDIGKPRVQIEDSDSKEKMEEKMKAHVDLGIALLDSEGKVPNEVKLIIAQHHEFNDGTGYPKKLKGGGIYDLARIVVIANAFDGLVADGQGTLVERQRKALTTIDQVMFRQFDPQKLEKAIKILKLGV